MQEPNHTESEQLLIRHRPVFLFDSTELYFPTSVPYYLSHGILRNDSVSISPILSDFTMYAKSKWKPFDASADPKQWKLFSESRECLHGFHGSELSAAPLYGTVVYTVETRHETGGYAVIHYLAFFPYKGPTYWCNCWKLSEPKQADWHVVKMVVHVASDVLHSLTVDGNDVDLSQCTFRSSEDLNCLAVSRLFELGYDADESHPPLPTRVADDSPFCQRRDHLVLHVSSRTHDLHISAVNDGAGDGCVWAPNVECVRVVGEEATTAKVVLCPDWLLWKGKMRDSETWFSPLYDKQFGLNTNY
jgi:hypothetical protein